MFWLLKGHFWPDKRSASEYRWLVAARIRPHFLGIRLPPRISPFLVAELGHQARSRE
jgi:hypothetical protein